MVNNNINNNNNNIDFKRRNYVNENKRNILIIDNVDNLIFIILTRDSV